MNPITLRILDGSDRGRIFDNVPTPVTIGREEGNTIQLNDERVSRFHIKIQEDKENLVLTDLESTNGTKVNGEEIQLRILRAGDMISLGRSVLLLGSRDAISDRADGLKPGKDSSESQGFSKKVEGLAAKAKHDSHLQARIYDLDPPDLPSHLSPGQAAQLSELMEYIHIRIRELINSVQSDRKGESIDLDFEKWQDLLELQSRIAEYMRKIGQPE